MDTLKQMMELIRKYKFIPIIILIGLFLMLLPEKEIVSSSLPEQENHKEKSTEETLAQILSKIQGVGRVEVMLTEAMGSRTVYVYDETTTQDSLRSDAVIVTDSGRAQSGLVSQIISPVYQGAIVVCQGGDNPVVRLAVVEAVCDATGLTADKITVLKMK